MEEPGKEDNTNFLPDNDIEDVKTKNVSDDSSTATSSASSSCASSPAGSPGKRAANAGAGAVAANAGAGAVAANAGAGAATAEAKQPLHECAVAVKTAAAVAAVTLYLCCVLLVRYYYQRSQRLNCINAMAHETRAMLGSVRALDRELSWRLAFLHDDVIAADAIAGANSTSPSTSSSSVDLIDLGLAGFMSTVY